MGPTGNKHNGGDKPKNAVPEQNRDKSIFGGLSAFGLGNAEKTRVYGAGETDGAAESEKAAAMKEIELGIYYKSFNCPVCETASKVPAVRSSHIRLIKSETDFMPVYKDPNPLYYFAVFCKYCGFAAIASPLKTPSPAQKKSIREKICAAWKFDKQYPAYYDPQTAAEVHKLALYNAVVAGEKESVKAIISLHLGWLYRIMEDAENETVFLRTAREGFEHIYYNERAPVGNLDKSGQQYLIGELLRRTGDLHGALDWFKLVLIGREAPQKIKNLARDQKDLIMAHYASDG